MGRKKLSTADLASNDITNNKVSGLGHIKAFKYAVRAIREKTKDGWLILEDKKPSRNLKQAKQIEVEFLKKYPHCKVEVIDLKGQLV